MKIQIEVEIFDDPEYCEDEDINCAYSGMNAVNNRAWCGLYGDYTIRDGANLKLLAVKCDQCKEAYQKEKEIDYCKLCGDEITYNKGRDYWEHVNTKPRHIATPRRK